MEKEVNTTDRRSFIRDAASLAAVGILGAGAILQSCSRDQKSRAVIPSFLDKAPDGRTLKVGLVGCGGRGTGILFNFLNAGPNIEVTALADVFQDRLDRSRRELKEHANVEIADEKCFLGFDAYQQLIESDVDIVALATPPFFRPGHFDAAIRARKHVFMEKPVAVDPVGARSIMAAARMADAASLKVGTGTQRRHQHDYVNTLAQIKSGVIGDIVAANCYWNQGQVWYINRQPGWSDMEYMIRDWNNWCWLQGDHILDQNIHNIDVINWFKGSHPVSAVGFGSRQRRPSGDQYDNFSIDFVYDDGMHMHAMCRQIDNCANNVSEHIVGTKGSSNCQNNIVDLNGNQVWAYQYPVDETGAPSINAMKSPYDQEIIALVAAIRSNTPFNEAEACAISTLTAIMGRISAYTGKEVTWEEMMNSNLRLGPEKLAMGPLDIKKIIPIPGAG
jgi:myo-inositol 2-dehydrogenase / D-chiro-inositol 1-dehydrogenase